MNYPNPFAPGHADETRASVAIALARGPLSVRPVTVRVSQGNPSDVARLLDLSRPISAAEFAEIEGK